MARKKRKRKKRKQIVEQSSFGLDHDTWFGILAIVFFAFSLILLLSLFGMVGGVGDYVYRGLSILFGWLVYVLPVILFFIALALLRTGEYGVRPTLFFGYLFFILSSAGLLHLLIPDFAVISAVHEGKGGGYIGMLLSYPLRGSMGVVGALIVLGSLFLISSMLIFNKSLKVIFEEIRERVPLFRKRGEESDDGEQEDEEEEYGEDDDEEEEVDQKDDSDEDDESKVKFQIKNIKSKLKRKVKNKEIKLDALKVKFRKKKIDLPMDLLYSGYGKPSSGNINRNIDIIEKTLEDFKIPVKMGEVSVGPSVTQYTLKPSEGIKLNKIRVLSDDLALALAAHPIRIEAPIPGKSLVGIEVPNKSVAMVKLRDILESPQFKKRKTNLAVPLGKDVGGNARVANLEKMPHLLIAGATGSGKSVCLNSVILSLLYQNSPEMLKFIMIDPKRVELSVYNDIPHLLTPVITDVKKTINSLKWLIAEMDRRYDVLAKSKQRNIQNYNLTAKEKMPYIVLALDELADLMVAAASEVETSIIRLAQMSRAVGIHLVLATQRPSVDVLTGLIKANIPARISFSVSSLVDSRTILDTAGAEKLIGRGDMLFLSADLSKPVRIQGSYVEDEEIKNVVGFLKERLGEPEFLESVTQNQTGSSSGFAGDMEDDGDELFEKAKETVFYAKKASTSFLQRKLRVGYARAARLMDLLEENGIVGPADGAKARPILIASLDEQPFDKSGYDVVDSDVQDYGSEDEYNEEDEDNLSADEYDSDEDDEEYEDFEDAEAEEGDEDKEDVEEQEYEDVKKKK